MTTNQLKYTSGLGLLATLLLTAWLLVGVVHGDTTADALANYETEMEKENVGTK